MENSLKICCEKFLELINRLLASGQISRDEYDTMIELKQWALKNESPNE